MTSEEEKKVTISEKTFAQVSNPEYFRYTNFGEWLADRKSERHKQIWFKCLSVIVIALLLGAASLKIVSAEVVSALIGGVVGFMGGNEFKL